MPQIAAVVTFMMASVWFWIVGIGTSITLIWKGVPVQRTARIVAFRAIFVV